nr:hypothetical protein [Tanacetum cinerariifolium]
AVEQHFVESNRFQDKMKEILNENERLLEQAISKDIVNIVVTANVKNAYEPVNEQLLKIDVAPLAPKLQNNRTAHYNYLKHTQEEIATLRKIVKNERLLNPLNTSLDYACDKLIAVTPVNKTKKIRFTEPITSSENTPIKTASSSNVVSNKPMLSSTGVNLPTSASGSQPSDIAFVPNSKLNVKSDLQCVMCNGCLFSDNHDSCVHEFINSMNARVKSKFAKKPLNKKIWKPTGKVFTNIGYKWRPTGRTFTTVGSACPLTRITTTAKVPLRKPILLESNTSNPVDLLFQPLFDELLIPPPSVDPPASVVIAPIAEVIAPEPDVEEDNYDIEGAHMGNDPLFGMPILEVASDQSSSTNSTHTIMHLDHQISQHNSKWTKDHPLENIIGQLARPVSTRLQLHKQALFCYYDAFPTSVEPKTYKDALTQSC